jgi:hypothetical protein
MTSHKILTHPHLQCIYIYLYLFLFLCYFSRTVTRTKKTKIVVKSLYVVETLYCV